MHDDDREMLRDSLTRLLADTEAGKLPAALAEFGWFELFATEPADAVPVLFETQGEILAASPMLDFVMAPPLAAAAGVPTGHDSHSAVLLPGPGAGAGPAALVTEETLELDGYLLPGGTGASRLLVVVGPAPGAGAGPMVFSFAFDGLGGPDGAGFSTRPVDGIDPWLGLVQLRARIPTASLTEPAGAGPAWETAVSAGRRALAHELIGCSRRMLALAVDHARERVQFGRPVGTFQAVQHRLAEAHVALTAAEAAATEAQAAADPLSAVLAKLWAGRAARLAGKHAQQVLGGMGFTWEHPFHRYLRRALLLDSLLGSAPELTADLGRRLIATGAVPELASL